MHNWKDIIIGLLTAYVVIDLLLIYNSAHHHSGALGALGEAFNDQNIAVIVVMGMAAGLLAYYAARRYHEIKI